ncbi:hypothetical protein [Aneurinibacillus terranovensis]|uniref:hypothetical protein n=1 Tax=Aneurinibacillus terranovensis TaxID=278991 RepID=UPI0004078822|nr:hypothetical protein [Aneurinibacillus terranovensis]
MKKLSKMWKSFSESMKGNKGGLGAIGGGIIMLLVLGYVAYTNRGNISTFFSTMWTYIQGKIQTIFS